MRDLRLWKILRAGDWKKEELLELLAEAKELPLVRRCIYIPACRELVRDEDPMVRKAAIELLCEATGLLSLQFSIDALADDDEGVRSAAMKNVAVAATDDRALWAHAVFHERLDARRAAAEQIVARGGRASSFLIYLMADPELRSEVKTAALKQTDATFEYSLLLDMQDRGALNVDEIVQLFISAGYYSVARVIQGGPNYSHHDLVSVAAGLAPTVHDPLQWLLILVDACDDELRDDFVDLLFQALVSLESITGQRARLRTAIVHVGRITGRWNSRLCGVSAAFGSELLLHTEIPRSILRDAIAVFHELTTRCRHADPSSFTRMLASNICRRDDGILDLWAIGGLLYLCGTDPYKRLEGHYSIVELRSAFWENPHENVCLFSHPASNQSRIELLRQITEGNREGIVYALLTQTIPASGLDFLSELDLDLLVEVFGELLRLAEHAEFKMSRNKCRVIGEHLSARLDLGSIFSLLTRWLAFEAPERIALGVEVFTDLAREFDAGDLVEIALQLPSQQLLRLAHVIPYCAGFPYGAEMRLASVLCDHDDQELRDWATVRLNSPTDAAPAVSVVIDDEVLTVGPELASHLSLCPDADLEDFLEPCLLCPHQGVIGPLLHRSGSRVNWDAVCLASVVSPDPLEELQALWDRFGGVTNRFLNRFDGLMVDQWQHRSSLSVLGHAWLFRWEHHAFEFGELVMRDDASAAHWLQQALSLKVNSFARKIWLATVRVLALWRYRDKTSLTNVIGPALIEPLVAGLSSHLADVSAAIWIELWKSEIAGDILAKAQPAVVGLVPFLDEEVRGVLRPWIDTRGLSRAAAIRSTASSTSSELFLRISRSIDFDELERWCRDADPAIVSDAAIRLLEMGDPGIRRLVAVLSEPVAVPGAFILAETVGLWGEEHLGLARALAVENCVPAPIRFLLALNLAEVDFAAGRPCDREPLFAPVLEPTTSGWFLPNDLSRLLKLDIPFGSIADELATAPHPSAYRFALPYLLEANGDPFHPSPDRVKKRCRDFLNCGDDREHDWRVRVAVWLMAEGDRLGFPILIQHYLEQQQHEITDLILPEDVEWCVDALLSTGPATVSEEFVLSLVRDSVNQAEEFRNACTRILTDARSLNVREAAAARLRDGLDTNRKLRRVAETFHWGVHIGRELTGRIMTVEMIGGDDLGYTRLTQNRIFINPIPMMKQAKHGRDVVEALILHEYGHHMYHRGTSEEKVWDEAQENHVGKLLNLVSDEHLERNLRAMDRDFGDRLKRLGAYAFQHDERDIDVDSLLAALRGQAWEVLTNCPLGVACGVNDVRVTGGRILQIMEQRGSSFSRFFRALRMGLGNRHGDPKVAAGLALFQNKFRQSSMERLLEITYKLREIFKHECDLLEAFGQDRVMRGDGEERVVHGAGITNEELQKEIQRIANPESESSASDDGPLQRWINVSEDESFDEIHAVIRLPSDRLAHAELSAPVAREARHFRQYLADLGVTMRPERRRMRGRRLDRSSMQDLILKSDPRMLIAREPYYRTDLFMAVIIDCSGSMEFDDNIEKAKLFAAMLADACRGLSEVDLRLFGFTDSVIYDAGDANRPAVAPLHTSGGNNDAAALWHAAQVAQRSKRRAKVLVMISDGLPTECSAEALRSLVTRLTRKYQMCCAQVAVQPLEEVCFPHYTLLEADDVIDSVRTFGTTVARLVRRALAK